MDHQKHIATLLFFLLFVPNILYGQKVTAHFYDAEGYDTSGRRQGYWKETSVLNYVNDKGFSNGVEGYEYGNFVNNEKVGVWEVKDTLGNLLGHRIYMGDTAEFEIQYKEGEIYSIVKSKSTTATHHHKEGIQYGDIVEIIDVMDICGVF
jgi:hypothetical protein